MTHAHVARNFWNRQADRYARKPVADEAAYRHKLSITQSYLRPHMDVLEFGCGTGSTALVHAPFVRSILATDLSPEMIAIARQKAHVMAVSNVVFQDVSIEELDAPSGHFDAILGLSVLHLVDGLEPTLNRVQSLLKPGGLFFSSTVCVRDMGAIPTALVGVLSAVRLGPPVNPFSADELVAALGRAGFDVVSTWRPAPTKALFAVARKPE
jgi:2-polyprenyl-3-methyl-5-hydroxy-6-metoxy-1,4-benzoquinol methylase